MEYFVLTGSEEWALQAVLKAWKDLLRKEEPTDPRIRRCTAQALQLIQTRFVDTDTRTAGPATALLLAVNGEDKGAVRQLLEAAADPNVLTSWGCNLTQSVLHHAAEGGALGMVKLLCEWGADLNQVGVTSVLRAVLCADELCSGGLRSRHATDARCAAPCCGAVSASARSRPW